MEFHLDKIYRVLARAKSEASVYVLIRKAIKDDKL